MNDRAEVPPGMSTPDLADGLSDVLTVIMISLERLETQALTREAFIEVARANTAVKRAAQLLWRMLDKAQPCRTAAFAT